MHLVVEVPWTLEISLVLNPQKCEPAKLGSLDIASMLVSAFISK